VGGEKGGGRHSSAAQTNATLLKRMLSFCSTREPKKSSWRVGSCMHAPRIVDICTADYGNHGCKVDEGR
jgi:hypothetical protein